MKRNMLTTMDKLEIDEGVRKLIRQLWKHCYKTTNSCDGHGSQAYIMFTGGDGWFEDKALQYGLEKYVKNSCCEKKDNGKCCEDCGAGINGNFIYRGILIQNPFKPEL